MSDTPRLGLPLLAAGQAQKHVTHNDALMRLDALMHLVVASRTQTAPPASHGETSAYIVPAGGSGVFAGHEDDLAIFEDGGWTFLEPRAGWQAWVSDEAEHHVWTGTQWRRSQPESSLGAEFWGVNATADTTTRLAVAADASLFNHAGTDHRLKLNKAAAARTASLLFQDSHSGRAEIGLAGDDQLRIKVSPDGASWIEALVVDRESGLVTLPASTWARETPQPNLLINGDFQINQRAFVGGALAAGAYGYDRWKGHAGGAVLSRSGFDLVLTSGAIVQLIEPEQWGAASFASTPLCLSVEGLSGGALTVAIGSASGTITPGSGRRSVALTAAAGDTGNLPVRLSASSGAASFGRVKLEVGDHATPWQARSQTQERQLCQRYHWRPGYWMLIDTFQAASCYFTNFLPFPTQMRSTPTPSFTVTEDLNVLGGERTIGASSPAIGYARLRANAQGRVYAIFDNIAFDAEL